MDNYQLYRTNVALSGQIRWDISIDNGSRGLAVSDFHINPVSERVPFNRYAHDNLLNYKHIDNIKGFYKKIESTFFTPYTDPLLSSNQPIVQRASGRSGYQDLHDSTFDMGASRARYSVYGKSIRMFCPVWLEDMYDQDNHKWKPIHFIFDVKSVKDGAGKILCSNTLTWDPNEYPNEHKSDFHDRFVKYFYQYLSDIALNDRIMNINLDEVAASVIGVDVSTGRLRTINVDKLTRDLLDKERLLMDADSMLVDQFSNNHLIARQLFNFNFLFDIEEFFPPVIMNMLTGSSLFLDVRVAVGDKDADGGPKVLEIKDFYTNYNMIPCAFVGPTNVEQQGTVNVFDILKDQHNIDLIDKNIMSQTICHWSLIGDNDYIFNVYPEFGGYYYLNDDEDVQRISQLYQDTPNIWLTKYMPNSNNLGWLNNYTIRSKAEYELTIGYSSANINELVEKSSVIGKGWIKHNKYTLDSPLVDGTHITRGIVVRFEGSDDEWTSALNNFESLTEVHKSGQEWYHISASDKEVLLKICTILNEKLEKEFLAILLVNTQPGHDKYVDGVTFAGLQSLDLDAEKPGVNYLEALRTWMSGVIQPSVVTFNKGLGYMGAKGPGKCELAHYNTVTNKHIIRMGGYVRPTFVVPSMNTMYTKKQFVNDTDFQNSVFTVYGRTGYPPKYPSIGYFPWDRHELVMSSDRDIKCLFDESALPYEYKWFTINKVYVLEPEFEFVVGPREPGSVENMILEHLKEMYHISDDDEVYYIYKQYDWKSDWEYASETDINNYLYTIKMKLK